MSLKQSPKEYFTQLPALNIKTTILTQSPKIKNLIDELTIDGVRAVLILFVTDFLKSFNITNTMSPHQIGEAVDLLIEKYPNYKLEDFKLCFKYTKMSRYGKVYNRIDIAVIFDMFNQYDAERTEILESATIKQHVEVKKIEKETDRVGGWDKNKLKTLCDLATELRSLDKKEKNYKPVTINEQQKLDNHFFRLFDKLCLKFEIKSFNGQKVAGKHIKRYGLIMSANEFLIYKHKQKNRVTEYLKNKQLLCYKDQNKTV